MNRQLSALALALLGACSTFDPTGTFTGDATSITETRVYAGPPAADGSATVDTNRSQSTTAGARVIVRRTSERQIEVDLGFCRLRVEHGEDELARSGLVTEGQVCNVEVGGRTEAMPVLSGNVDLPADGASGLSIDLTGSLRRDVNGVPEGYFASWIWTFRGERTPE
ncbi:MAG: hypothetical protein M5U28_43320 [Sandaracinaceae bacterium]|nr:hypothetical protein [Sandaracinaceae bacterium]